MPPMNRHLSLSAYRSSFGLIGWLVVAFSAAGLGGIASANASEFYRDLARPSWSPPGWLFGPVWTALYIMMGVSAWLVWRARGFAGARRELALFIGQLAVNALWTWLFFVWCLGGIAFVEILVLAFLIITNIFMFYRISKLAGILLVPYLAWVLFACTLTFATWQLNPGILG